MKLFLIFLSMLYPIWILGQDIHFSQFYETPQLINPALTGVFNGEHRVILNYKNQWKSISFPYKTVLVSYDMRALNEKRDNAYLGAGLMAYYDKAGKSEFGTTQVSMSLSGNVSLDKHHSVSAGLQGGLAQKNVNYTDLRWGNQFNGEFYDPNATTGETGKYQLEPFFYGDFAAGLNWNYSKNPSTMASRDHLMFNAGAGFFHVTRPKQQFYNNETDKLYSKLTVHARAYYGIKNTTITAIPGILYMRQGPSQEIDAGILLRYMLREESKYTGFIRESSVFFGGYFRPGDAFIPIIMFEIANFTFGISYDVNVSGLKTVSKGRGGVELSLRYINPNPYQYGKGTRGTPML